MASNDLLQGATNGTSTMKKIILVTGATGAQGGATIRALQTDTRSDWHIRALVRNPNNPAAKALAAQGIEIIQGDMENETSVCAAMAGVHGVFSVQPMDGGAVVEERQGLNVARSAADTGVSHFVYTSVGGAERNSGVPHFESKFRIERHIANFNLPATILRPAAFMDNFKTFKMRTMMLSMWRTFMPANRTLQLVATDDIGRFAAKVFAEPAKHIGQQIEIAGDAVTREQVVHTLRKAGLVPAIGFKIPALLHAKLPEEFRMMFNWFANEGYQADIAVLQRLYPNLMTLDTWAIQTALQNRKPV